MQSSQREQLRLRGLLQRPNRAGSYATVFEEMNALQHFEAFCL